MALQVLAVVRMSNSCDPSCMWIPRGRSGGLFQLHGLAFAKRYQSLHDVHGRTSGQPSDGRCMRQLFCAGAMVCKGYFSFEKVAVLDMCQNRVSSYEHTETWNGLLFIL